MEDKEKSPTIVSKIENVLFGIIAVLIFGLSLFSGLGVISQFSNNLSLRDLLMGVSVLSSGILSFIGILKKWPNRYIFTLLALEFIVAEMFIVWLDYDDLKIQNAALAIICIIGFFGVVVSQIFKKVKFSVILTIVVLLALSAYILANVIAPFFQLTDATPDYTFLMVYLSAILLPFIFGIFKRAYSKSISLGVIFGFLTGMIFILIVMIDMFSSTSRPVAGEGPGYMFSMLTVAITLPSMVLGAFGGLVGYSLKWLILKIKTRFSQKQNP